MRIRLGLGVSLRAILVGAVPAQAQPKSQYIPVQQGLNSGLLPDPGFTYADLTVNYSAEALKNASGSTLPLTGSYDI